MSQTTVPLPTALYTAAQTRELDARLIAAGTPGFELMQRAARAAWRALRRRWPDGQQVTVLAGGGNNAGDGYLIAALAQRAGWSARVLAVGDPAALQGDARHAHDQALAAGVSVQRWAPGVVLEGVLVDALLGTGVSGEVHGAYRDAIEAISASGRPVLAVDLPSGLCADTGRILGCAVRADLTVTFIALKLGLFTAEAPACVGELVFDALEAGPSPLPPAAFRLDDQTLPALAPRARTAHKGSFGHVLVIGGDLGTGGAALLSSEAALRAGAGMVTLATRPEHVTASLVRLPEVMCTGVESTYPMGPFLERADVLVVGPGLGQGPWGRSLLSVAQPRPVPQVWDADALNLLATSGAQPPKRCLMTPHPGEAARLLQCTPAEVQADRPQAARELARRYRSVVLLKGAGTLIAAQDGRLAVCDRGHPAMASAGLGDVLAGLLGALLAQGLEPFEAACLGAWLHAVAGEQAGALGRGLVASELIPFIRQTMEARFPCHA